jgi:hypothetical protein
VIERVFMASETNNEQGRKWGPFNNAAEAEIEATKLGWGWVVVYANSVDERGTILDVQRRYYQPARHQLRTPKQIEELRRFLSTPDVKPLTGEEADFFAEYERQMEAVSGKNS